jgi:uncharacterized protein (DUF849 family)
MSLSEKAILTCALTGVLTDPKQHPVPVTPEEMANAALEAYNAGASIVHVHVRRQEPGLGHLPSWDPEVCVSVIAAIRQQVPKIIINLSTGILGDDIRGPAACLKRVKPEYAACNAGTLNYLKANSDGTWAWPPMIFDNPVAKIQAFLDVMKESGTRPEFECFDTGHVRSVPMYVATGMAQNPSVNFVMGVASGMPANPQFLPLLLEELPQGTPWQVTAIGRAPIWALHRKTAELGGNLRTGLEDTFYLENGDKAQSNGALMTALAQLARDAGRSIATPEETRKILNL